MTGTPTEPQPRQHYELSWLLGAYAFYGLEGYRNPAADAFPVIERQLREAEKLFDGSALSSPVNLPLCNIAWESLFVRMGATAYLATSLATVPRLRDVLQGLVEVWRSSIFSAEGAHFRHQVGTLDAALHWGSESHRMLDHDGTRFMIKLIAWTGAAKAGDVVKTHVTVVSYSEDGVLAQLPDFTPQTSLDGKDALHQDPAMLAQLLDRLKRDGPPKYAPAIGAELARRTGLSEPAAALLWAGNTEATDALKLVAAAETRKALGLTAQQVAEASQALRSLYRRSELPLTATQPRQGFYDTYQQAMPARLDDLWSPLAGGEDSVVARLGRAVLHRLAEDRAGVMPGATKTEKSQLKRKGKAATSQTSDALRFADQRRVEPLVLRLPGDEAFQTTSQLAHLTLADHERRQIGYLFRLFEKSLSDAEVVAGSHGFFEQRGFHELIEVFLQCPIEWWNVIDAAGDVRYQLWLYSTGGGYLFAAGTTSPVGEVGDQYGDFRAFGPEVHERPEAVVPGAIEAPPGLAAALASAWARVHKGWFGFRSPLADVGWSSSPRAGETALRFVDGRQVVEPMDITHPAEVAVRATPLFAHLPLAPHERRQLGFIYRLFDETLTDDQVVAGPCALTVPVEWWNVIATDGTVRYQVYGADGGYVFRGGTTDVVGGIVQCGFESLAEPATLGDQLAEALARHGGSAALERWLTSYLASVRFTA